MSDGRVKLLLTGADIPATIDLLCRQGFSLYNVACDGMLSAALQVPYGQFDAFCKTAQQQGNLVRVRGVQSYLLTLKRLLHRPVIFIAVGILLFLTIWIPSRILFVAVEGCENVSVPQILVQAEKCGIYFGASRRDIRSEIVKNQLLKSIPELRWAGVTTSGCTATIHVLEEKTEDKVADDIPYSNIVAGTDGVVVSCVVTSGVATCSVGDAVKAGQVLISGYQDLGLLVRLSRSQGEVFAQTERTLSTVTPSQYSMKRTVVDQKTVFSLLIGKKRINLLKDSGIYYTGCDKIYSTYYLTLPGGLILPVALSVEQILIYAQSSTSCDPKENKLFLLEQSDAFVHDAMVSGRAQRGATLYQSSNDFDHLTVQYSCVEMIGRERKEELNIQYGKDD